MNELTFKIAETKQGVISSLVLARKHHIVLFLEYSLEDATPLTVEH